ncbi:hypothetical protein XM48_14075 [Leucobacter sp. Ag1]|nr:hypothetical protein XM48_14075 [Leucobacter sp. Ag1]
MNDFRIPVGDWVAGALDWFKDTFTWLLDFVGFVMQWLVSGLTDALLAVPFPALILLFALIGWFVRSWQLALGTVLGFLLIVAMGQWETSMQTLALVLIATLLAVIIAVPLGILAARNDAFSAFVKPVLDFMQTMPAFVYLIPAVTFFSIGVVPGVFSTVIFALAPGVRFTELGIRGVDSETVEAGHAFGATPGRILRGIQLPLAMPTIMAGINQVIMLALSMAVVAGFVGADGLGKEVIASISTLNLSQGVEAGLGVVILAVFLDRVTAALGTPSKYRSSVLGSIRRAPSAKAKRMWFGLAAAVVAIALVAVGSLAVTRPSGGTDEATGGAGSGKTITLGFLPSWTDGLSMTYLLKDQLEKEGYTVELKELTEAAVLYTGLAKGDVDIYPSAWSEKTHASYMKKYGTDIEDLGAYYDNAVLTIAVPKYVDIDSIEDLKGNAKRFDGKIIGIEPSAGLTEQTQNTMMPEYGLDKEYELVTSSTATMLTTLQNAIDKKQDIAVTLWRPFWANDKFPVKDLKDPKGAMGKPEALHFLANKGFSEKHPDIAKMIAGIKLDDAEYGSLEDLVVNRFGKGKEPEAVTEWLKEHPDAYPTLVTK